MILILINIDIHSLYLDEKARVIIPEREKIKNGVAREIDIARKAEPSQGR